MTFNVAGATMVTLIAEDADGKRSMKSEILTVTPRAFGAIRLENLVQDYDGSVKNVVCTTNPAGLEDDIRIVYRQNGEEVVPQEAGLYEVTATYAGTVPYAMEEVTARLEIRKMPIRILASALRQTYTGEVLKAVITTDPVGYEDYVDVKYFQDEEEVEEPVNSGIYRLSAEVHAENYEAEPLETEFAIRKIDGIIRISLEKEYIYDGAPKLVRQVTTEPAGLETVVTYNGDEAGAVEVGEYIVIATIADVNYEGVAWETMTVKSAAPEVQIIQNKFEYDGRHHDLVFRTVPENLDCEVSYSKDGEPVEAVVDGGVYDYTIAITGENHNTVVYGQLEITRASAQLRISGLRAVYDGETKRVEVITEPADLAVEVTYNGFTQLPYAPGEYTVFAEIRDRNYRGYKTAVLQIVRKVSDMKIMDLVVADGTHDCIFRIPELQTVSKSLVIYNQQGAVVYENREYQDDFDMRDLPAGTYYYILQYTENGERQTIKSFVEVIRK